MADNDHGRMSLEEYTKTVPPGWKPGDQRYPFKLYLTKLRLWWRFADVEERAVGPLIASRLRGAAFDIASTLKVERADERGLVTVHYNDDALSLTTLPEILDPNTGRQLMPPQPSRGSCLIRTLIAELGIHDQDQQTIALDEFFDYRRDGSTDLATYTTYDLATPATAG